MGWLRRSAPVGALLATIGLLASLAGSGINTAGAAPNPTIAISAVSQVEGAAGATTIFHFTVTVTDPVGGSAHGNGHVSFYTTDGSAHAPGDYTEVPQASPKLLGITAGTDTYSADVTVVGNDTSESDKTFTVTLVDAGSGFEIDSVNGSATGTIVNDDGSGNYSITNARGTNAAVVEGNSGQTSVLFHVTRTQPGVAADVAFAVSSPTATAGVDYTVATTSPVHFAAADTTHNVDVRIVGDTVAEPNESVVVTLGAIVPPPTSVVVASASLVIQNDDTASSGFTVSNAEVHATEGAASTTTSMTFTVSRTAADVVSTVDYTLTDAGTGATRASCTTDYFPVYLSAPDPNCETAPYHGTVTFNAGTQSKPITVKVVGDDLPEGAQAFNVVLSNFVNAAPAPPDYSVEAHGTIDNDDGVGVVTLAAPAASVAEGTQMLFTVARTWGGGRTTPPVEQDVTVPWHASGPPGGGQGIATPGSDFRPTSGTVSLAAGAVSGPIAINALQEHLHEPDESVAISLDAPLNGNATLGNPSSATGVIAGDGPGSFPTVLVTAIGGLRHVGTSPVTFTIGLSKAPGEPVAIGYQTMRTSGLNAAIPGTHFAPVTGEVDFAQAQKDPQAAAPITLLPQGTHKDQVFAFRVFSRTAHVVFDHTYIVTIAGVYTGFRVLAADGATYDYDGATHLRGCNPHCGFIGDVTGMSPSPDQRGFWLATTEGRIYTSGTASFYGGLPRRPTGGRIEAIAATPDGLGYWLLGRDGGVFSFGSAAFYGGLGGLHITSPAINIVPTPTGHGYWIQGADGGIFSFGDAAFYGSLGGHIRLSPGDFVASMARTSDGKGYWIVSARGGIYAFGNARYAGNAINRFPFGPSAGAVVGITPTSDDRGYVIVTSDNNPKRARAFVFGNAQFASQGALAERFVVNINAASLVIGASSV